MGFDYRPFWEAKKQYPAIFAKWCKAQPGIVLPTRIELPEIPGAYRFDYARFPFPDLSSALDQITFRNRFADLDACSPEQQRQLTSDLIQMIEASHA